MTKLIIGCPLYKRAKVLPHWFEAIEKQDYPLEDLGFVFILGPDDDETHNFLFEWHASHPEVNVFDASINVSEEHSAHTPNKRTWNYEKYHKMVALRNQLLKKVRCHQPDKFFSLDSDVLLEDPGTIRKLDELTDQAEVDAAAPLMYMYPTGTSFPDTMTWLSNVGGPAKRLLRNYPIGETFKTDIIMAAKMMTKPVYNQIDYMWHRQGEDLGWSGECGRAGFSLFLMSGTYVPHIMYDSDIEKYLKTGDQRKPDKELC